MRKDAMADLSPKAELTNFQSSLEDDSIFYSDSLLGKNWIVAVIGADSLRAKHLDVMRKIFNQSKDEFSINIFTIVGLFPGELIRDMSQILQMPTSKTWLRSYMAANHVYPFSAEAYSIPEQMKDQDCLLYTSRCV